MTKFTLIAMTMLMGASSFAANPPTISVGGATTLVDGSVILKGRQSRIYISDAAAGLFMYDMGIEPNQTSTITFKVVCRQDWNKVCELVPVVSK